MIKEKIDKFHHNKRSLGIKDDDRHFTATKKGIC